MRKMVNLGNGSVSDVVTSTCKFTGKYDVDPKDYACTDCNKPGAVTNGNFLCLSKTFAADSQCLLQCNQGFVASMEQMMTCKKNMSEDGLIVLNHYWDKQLSQFKCEKQVTLVVGGSDSKKE